MSVTTAAPAPYAPPSAILEVINRHRSRGLPSPITGEVLGRAGVSESLIPRTLLALQTLDLIDEKGAPTATLEGLRLAQETEFKNRLAEWLNGAYADVLNFVDPATADEVAIRDAFRTYNPVGQQPRMVTLFQGLYAAAGVIADKQTPTRASRPALRIRPRPPAQTGKGEARKPVMETPAGLPPPLAGLFASLPQPDEGWTQEKRDKFVTTFAAVLDFCFPVIAEQEVDHE